MHHDSPAVKARRQHALEDMIWSLKGVVHYAFGAANQDGVTAHAVHNLADLHMFRFFFCLDFLYLFRTIYPSEAKQQG